MVQRKKDKHDPKPFKLAQTFFCLDADTKQPICFTSASSARSVTKATPELLSQVAEILKINRDQPPLVMADNEHYTVGLFDWVYLESPFDMLVPMQQFPVQLNRFILLNNFKKFS